MRSERPFVFTDLKRGAGVDRIVSFLQESGGL
jgi:urease accessory protein